MKRKTVSLALKLTFSLGLMFATSSVFSQTPSYRIDYIKGNFSQKTQCVKQAADKGDVSLALESIDFALSVRNVLGEDRELNILVETSVRCLKKNTGISAQDVSGRLVKLFDEFSNSNIRIAILDTISVYPSDQNIVLLNNYIYNRCQSGQPMDDVLLKAIECSASISNHSTFWYLFTADVIGLWPEYSEILEKTYIPLADECEAEVLQIFSNVTPAQKRRVLKIFEENEEISKKIRGETAENALFEAITYWTGNSNYSEDYEYLAFDALKAISETQWTRACSIANNYFVTASEHYAEGKLTDEEFASVVGYVASLASVETSQVISSYLDTLNKAMENGNVPVKAVVLSVINALGGLGDKAAFDYLLYVTYLDYSDDIKSAARTALSKLRW